MYPTSQEFLRFFLDGLTEDLNRRQCSAGAPSTSPAVLSEDVLSKLPAEQQADRAWALHVERNDSEVTSMFCGQLQSRICCLTCGNVSYCFDPFFDLSVPLAGRISGTGRGASGGGGGGAKGKGNLGQSEGAQGKRMSGEALRVSRLLDESFRLLNPSSIPSSSGLLIYLGFVKRHLH